MRQGLWSGCRTVAADHSEGRQKGATNAMDIAVGDTILTRKKHPCGASSFEVLRVGMDFKIRCTGCGREVMLPRAKIEKNIKKVVKPAQQRSDRPCAHFHLRTFVRRTARYARSFCPNGCRVPPV